MIDGLYSRVNCYDSHEMIITGWRQLEGCKVGEMMDYRPLYASAFSFGRCEPNFMQKNSIQYIKCFADEMSIQPYKGMKIED